jgi:hypothetical protein
LPWQLQGVSPANTQAQRMRSSVVRQLAYDHGLPASAARVCLAFLCMGLLLAAGACSSNGLPNLGGTGQIETSAAGSSAADSTQSPSAPIATATTVSGEPVGIYTLVARSIHACWFGAGGPLRNTHVFRAEAQSQTKGGEAEITIHERDLAQADQRGQQAVRIAFENAAGLVRVGITVMKVPPGYGEPMARDVAVWAKGQAGCELRANFPPAPEAAAQKLPGKPSVKTGAKGAR